MKKVKDLTYNELVNLFENNEGIRTRVFKDLSDMEYYTISNEYISYFRHYREGRPDLYTANFEDDAWGNISVEIDPQTAAKFIEDCVTFNEKGVGFSEDGRKILKRLEEKTDLYFTECATYGAPEDLENFEEWFLTNTEKLADELKNLMQAEIDLKYDDEYMKEYFINIYHEYIEDLVVDPKTWEAYETIINKIA